MTVTEFMISMRSKQVIHTYLLRGTSRCQITHISGRFASPSVSTPSIASRSLIDCLHPIILGASAHRRVGGKNHTTPTPTSAGFTRCRQGRIAPTAISVTPGIPGRTAHCGVGTVVARLRSSVAHHRSRSGHNVSVILDHDEGHMSGMR